MKFGSLWQVVLGIWLILLGVVWMDWVSIDIEILGIGAIIAGVLALVNRERWSQSQNTGRSHRGAAPCSIRRLP